MVARRPPNRNASIGTPSGSSHSGAIDGHWAAGGRLPPPVDRLTMTLPVLNAAAHVVFLVAGAGKAGIVREILGSAADAEPYPAQLVSVPNGRLTWMLDEAAAAELRR